MSYYELFQTSPLLFCVVLIFSLIMTLIVYGAFPVIFAKTRKKPITKRKYKVLCYGVNVIGVMFFIIFNGAASGGPYLLWTFIFSNYGVKTLRSRSLLMGCEKSTGIPKICFCRKCGTNLDDGIRFCRKCGTEIKTEE